MTANQFGCSAAIGVVLFAASCGPASTAKSFPEKVGSADKVVLREGLPHQMYEGEDLRKERRSKPVEELNGYSFYQEPLPLNDDDAKQLTGLMANPELYTPFSGEKKCGGFHPDYAVEFHVGTDVYRVLVCFGCGEFKVFGPGLEARYDIGGSGANLRDVLKGYRKNRPVTKYSH